MVITYYDQSCLKTEKTAFLDPRSHFISGQKLVRHTAQLIKTKESFGFYKLHANFYL